jgi:hypothetical protein
MALMDAKEYDPRPAQRRWRLAGIAAALLLVFLVFWFWPSGRFRYWQQWSVADRFLAALEQKDFDAAYGIYFADPDWKQHPEKYARYTINQFKLDWGPQGDYGAITSHRVDCALELPKKDFASPTGVVVVVIINNLHDTKSMWVEKESKTITDSPRKVLCHGDQ